MSDSKTQATQAKKTHLITAQKPTILLNRNTGKLLFLPSLQLLPFTIYYITTASDHFVCLNSVPVMMAKLCCADYNITKWFSGEGRWRDRHLTDSFILRVIYGCCCKEKRFKKVEENNTVCKTTERRKEFLKIQV